MSGLDRAITLLGLGAITLPGLGKRDLLELQEWHNKEQAIKRGKMSNDEGNNDHVSAGVESHPCREQ